MQEILGFATPAQTVQTGIGPIIQYLLLRKWFADTQRHHWLNNGPVSDYIHNMTVTVPDNIAEASHLTPETALLDVAIGIYKREQWSLGRCAKIVEMSRSEFQNELGKREIPINYDTADLDQDLETTRTLFPNLK